MIDTYHKTQILRFSQGKSKAIDDGVITEQPVSLTINSQVWLTFMCTPVDLEALAAGFLFNESIISTIDEIEDIRVCEHQDNVDVWLNRHVDEPKDWRRTSGCTGGYTTAILDEVDPIPSDNLCLTPENILSLVRTMFESQDIYRKSGGVHASALASKEKIILQLEDVGRHNTLDKIAGRILLEDISINPKILLTTGRISSEMLQKAARLKTGMLISRTSPTSMSVDLAKRLGITLIGYARGHRFNVYTHPERVST